MQAPIHILVSPIRHDLIVANVGGCSRENTTVILSGARSAEKPALSEVEGKDPRLPCSLRRICR
jgi:hypothetical protein